MQIEMLEDQPEEAEKPSNALTLPQRAEQERLDAKRKAEEERLQAERDELERQRREFQAELDKRAAEATALETVTTIEPETVAEPKPDSIDEPVEQIAIDPQAMNATTVPSEQPTLKLDQICDRLGFTVSGDFLRSLGAEPRAVDKRALLFYESDFRLIAIAIVQHVTRVAGI